MRLLVTKANIFCCRTEVLLAEKVSLRREIFLGIAEDSGLDIHAPYLENLYAYLLGLRPTLKTIEDLDLTGLEPFMPPLEKEEG